MKFRVKLFDMMILGYIKYKYAQA